MATSPWNPDFALLASAYAVVVGAAATHRSVDVDVAGVAICVAQASFAAQAHLSYVFPGIVLCGVVLLLAVVVDRERPRHLVDVALVVSAAVVVWIGPLVDAAANRGGGNLKAVATSDSDLGSAGLGAAYDRDVGSIAP